MTIRYIAKTTQVIPFDKESSMIVSTMVDKNQLLDNFTMDELLAECNRRHKAQPIEKPKLFFAVKGEGQFANASNA